MNGKDNIINKILADADNKCAEILSAAQSQAQEIADSANAACQREKESIDKRLANLGEERSKNRLSAAQLDARKYKLAQKQQLIASCYQKALVALQNLPAGEKKAFLTKLINNYAEKGEVVYVTKADKDIVTQKFLDSFNKNLTLGKTLLDAQGGLVLEGNGYDKDLTLEKIVSAVRDETEAQVANALFGE